MADFNCIMCNKSPATACSGCKSSRYCSPVCQKLDWPLHKAVCKKFTRVKPKSSSNMKLGILLSADDPDPKFVWVPCIKTQRTNPPVVHDSPAVDTLLGLKKAAYPQTEKFNVGRNDIRGYTLDHAVVLYARDNWLNDGSKPNQAALALTDWKLPYDWRGNILIMSYTGKVGPRGTDTSKKPIGPLNFVLNDEGGDPEPYKDYQDVTTGDLRSAIDFLNCYRMDTKRGKEHSEAFGSLSNFGEDRELGKMMAKMKMEEEEKDKKRKVQAVVIRCEGHIEADKKRTGKWERYSEIKVTKDHPIWNETPTPASKVIGLPLLVYKLPQSPAWNQGNHARFDNQPATFLNFTVDPEDHSWGFAPQEWQSEVGSVLVVRQDERDISRNQVWALAEYMQFRVSDSFESAMESGEPKDRRDAMKKMLNWTRFEIFLENFKVEMASADSTSWKDATSPFGTMECSN